MMPRISYTLCVYGDIGVMCTQAPALRHALAVLHNFLIQE
jgi:hypothetical protein